jgi:mRNA interferase HigB
MCGFDSRLWYKIPKVTLGYFFVLLEVPNKGTFAYLWRKRQNLRVIAKKILRDFWQKHSDCEQQLKSWYREAEKGDWKTLNEIKKEYPSASILRDNRIVFNIKGNNYRLIVKVNLHYQMIWIRFIGTHKEYDKIDANKI